MKTIIEIPPQELKGVYVTSGLIVKQYSDGTFDIEPATDGSISVTAQEIAMVAEACLSAERS